MRRHLVYLLAFLCFTLVSCKDDENEDDGRIYPEEPQTPFQVTNRTGMLVYVEPKNEWEIYLYSEDDVRVVDTIYCVKDMPKDFQPQTYKDIIFSGEAIYLYYTKMTSGEIMHYCSLYVSEISHNVDAQTRTVNSTMECPTPAPEPPLWFFDPQTRNMNNYLINVFVHIVRSSSGNGYNKELVSQNVIRILNE